MPRTLIIGLLLVVALSTRATAEPPTAAEIAQAIAQLGDDSFQTREAATRFLWQAGAASERALEKAALSDDPEVTVRARMLLKRFALGIFPDTPPEVAEKLYEFRDQPNKQNEVLAWLANNGNYKVIVRLIRQQEDAEIRAAWAARHLSSVKTVVKRLIVTSDFDEAEALLDLAAISETGIRHWAAYLVQQGHADAQLRDLQASLQAELPEDERKQVALRLTYLQRATGDLESACTTAELTGNKLLVYKLWHEAGRWDLLSRQANEDGLKVERPAGGDPFDGDPFGGAPAGGDPTQSAFGRAEFNRLAFVEAWHRRAGRDDLAKAARAKIEALPVGDIYERDLLKMLLIDDTYEAGLQRLDEKVSTTAFELRVYRRQYREAFMHAGVTEVKPPYARWFSMPEAQGEAEGEKADVEKAATIFSRGLEVAKQLHALGEVEDARALLDHLQTFLDHKYLGDDDRQDFALALCRCGYREKGIAIIGSKLDSDDARAWFHQLYGDDYGAALAIFVTEREDHPDESLTQWLNRIDRWLAPAAKRDVSVDDWTAMIRRVTAPDRAESLRGYHLKPLAQRCRDRGDDANELAVLKTLARVDKRDGPLAVGEFYLRRQQWQEAVDWFAALPHGKGPPWDENAPDPIAVYLHGYALTKLGRQDAGQRNIHLAQLLLLADGQRRFELGETLQRLELQDAARREWEFLIRSDEIGDVSMLNANQKLADLIIDEDPARAAELRDNTLVNVFENRYSLDNWEYFELPQTVHAARGRALIAAGDAPEAMRELELAFAANPGDIDLPLEVVPLLEKAGWHDEAVRLMTLVYDVNEQVCEDFPRSALHHNRCAWLAARCRMRLDDALVHAEKAVELAPEKVAYLDTLAEVHFAQGDREKAVEIMRRCVKMAPADEEFRTRLADMEKNLGKSSEK